METRNISLTLDKAREWYNSGNEALKEAVLQAFNENELNFDFTKIKRFVDVLAQLSSDEKDNYYIAYKQFNGSQLALIKLNLIRRVLNSGFEMKATEGDVYYPYNPLITLNSIYYKEELKNKNLEEVAHVLIENKEYILLGGQVLTSGQSGFLCSLYYSGVSTTDASAGLLGCATKKIAKHMSLYFAREIFDAKYNGWLNYKWL